jgi:DNA-binding response OmpR family regulator
MGGTSDGKATVLVVDDEPEVADAYSKLLATEYGVLTAYGGEEALSAVGEDVDVVLLDRRMPELSGDDVLGEIHDRDLEVSVVMVTAVDPGFDILDMAFDDYLCKPVDAATLRDAVEQQLRAQNYDDQLDEFFEVTAKMGVLEARRLPGELEDDEEYGDLSERADDLQSELSDIVEEFDDIAHAFNDIDRV